MRALPAVLLAVALGGPPQLAAAPRPDLGVFDGATDIGGQGTLNVPSWAPDGERLALVSNTGGY